MPLYEYRCHKCGEKFEVIQKFADSPLTVHEGCGGAVERLISLSGFSLKGSGWYATDYAKGSASGPKKDASETKSADSKPGESKPAETKASEAKTSETKTESKPAGTAKTE